MKTKVWKLWLGVAIIFITIGLLSGLSGELDADEPQTNLIPAVSYYINGYSPTYPLPCIRHYESTDNYHPTYSGYWGAYQFSQTTWNGIVQRIGRSDLVNVRPNLARPEDQDAAALQLYYERRFQPWGEAVRRNC